jgi:beta-phosphoglucomutase
VIKCILYDLDGVLVDACEIHYESFNRALMDVCGFKLSRREHDATFNGLPTKKKLEILHRQGRADSSCYAEIYDAKQTYTWEQVDMMYTDPIKVDLHTKIRHLGLKVGCVTNSILLSAEKMLLHTGQHEFMNILISNEDVANPKPNSEGYVTAMVRLETEPSETLIVEDSPKGLEAARATGARVLEVENATKVTWDTIREAIK